MAGPALVAWGRLDALSGVLNTDLEAQIEAVRSGRCRHMHVEVENAPGQGCTDTFTLLVNGAATALQVVIGGGATAGDNTVDVVDVVEGDVLAVGMVLTENGCTTPGKIRCDVAFS